MLIASAQFSLVIQLMLAVLGTGGLASALVALFKLKPEVNASAVVQAQSVLDMMKSVIEELRDELQRKEKELADCRSKVRELERA